MRSKYTLFLALLYFAPCIRAEGPTPNFALKSLVDGVHIALAVPGGTAVSNAALVDLGGFTILFDTTLSHASTRELLAAVPRLKLDPLAFSINSHAHKDHTWGNQLLGKEVCILATEWTREAMLRDAPKDDPAKTVEKMAQAISVLESDLAKHPQGRKREETLLDLGYCRAVMQTCSTVRGRLPDLCVKSELTLHGTKSAAHLFAFPGSTPGDLCLYLPAQRVLLAGDLVFNGVHPFLNESDPSAWAESLRRLEELNPRIVVPGHGPMGGPELLRTMRQYLAEVLNAARTLQDQGKGPDAAEKLTAPAPFDTWHFSAIYRRNVAYVMQGIAKE